ncbi:hypothetical protein B9G98_04153 [Wickerhamiella sorbophila]|uniref:YMC020W-like alpha/beta hydrolase domain-containing protein n=1 Tax=Wickerhamiella sorbophila TaxID=45607 RepID=A0A2T0FNG4_9ASCO|nr:hypothetical protein B9G98_04153 [Wickerhamiella sorbophila]PRT56533.1 hypothetical protein B9G98_04153 [Wickerhamiella sorbophila]
MFRKRPRVSKSQETSLGLPPTETVVAAHSIEFATQHFEPVSRSSTGETIVQSQQGVQIGSFEANSTQCLRRLQVNVTSAGDDDPPEQEAGSKGPSGDPTPATTTNSPRSQTWYSWALSRKSNDSQIEPQSESNESSQAPEDIVKGKDTEGSSWAFWSKRNYTGNQDEGELAITGTDSAQHPKHATVVEHKPLKSSKKSRPSLVIPPYVSSLEWQSPKNRIFSSLARWGLGPHQQKVYRTKPPAVKRVVVVGVHGYFPARMTRAILGEPTGTSIKFAHEAAAELELWAAEHNYQLEIEKIALEGEGKIDHRVSSLYLLLLNWQDHLQNADLVFFAAHSQGTVVTTHLIARLFTDKLLKPNQRVGFLGMAGTCLGPVPGMDQTLVGKAITRIENDSLQELFQLQNPHSTLSKAFMASLSSILSQGVKITLVGATDDQLVPLFSALCTSVSHPNLLRGAYLDGEDVAPEVIAPLLELAIMALNRGQSDAGVIVELSSALSGALTGKGHSKLYSNNLVYRLGIEATLETSTCTAVPPVIDENFVPPRSNPYVLPWALHDLFTQLENQPEFTHTIDRLKQEYASWKPEAKNLKDLKYRMGALKRAKL